MNSLKDFDKITTIGDLKEFLELLAKEYSDTPAIKIFENNRKVYETPKGKSAMLKTILDQVKKSKNDEDDKIEFSFGSAKTNIGFSVLQIKQSINSYLNRNFSKNWREEKPKEPKRDEEGRVQMNAATKGTNPNEAKLANESSIESMKIPTNKYTPLHKLFNEAFINKHPITSEEDKNIAYDEFIKNLSEEDKGYIEAFLKDSENKENRAEVIDIINYFLNQKEPKKEDTNVFSNIESMKKILNDEPKKKTKEGTKTLANTNEPKKDTNEETKQQDNEEPKHLTEKKQKAEFKEMFDTHKEDLFNLLLELYEEIPEKPNAFAEDYNLTEEEKTEEKKKIDNVLTVFSDGIKKYFKDKVYDPDGIYEEDKAWMDDIIREKITDEFLPSLLSSQNQLSTGYKILSENLPEAMNALTESNKETLEKLIKEYKKKEDEILQLESATETDNDFLKVYQKYISSDLRNYIKRLYGLAFAPNEQFDLNKVIKTIYNYMGRPANGLSDAQKIATKVYLDLVSFNSQMNTLINKPDQANIKPKLATIEKSDEFMNYNPKLFNQLHRTQSSFNQMKSMKNYKPDYNNYSPYQNINQLRYTRVRDF